MTVECGSAFSDPGATAWDEELGDLTAQVQVTGSVDAHAVGTYVLTYSVSNAFLTTTLTRTVEVVDTTPPALTLLGGPTVTVEKGSPFVDPGATAIDTCAGDLTAEIGVSGTVDTCTVGNQALTYTVTDGFNTSTVTRVVKVRDTRPPAITGAAASPSLLWPPDHRLVPVTVTVQVEDACGGAVRCRIVSVSSDEPFSLLPDWIITGDLTLKLRAERWPFGNGRTYTIRVQCRDASGNASTTFVKVTVPRRAP
jgi:hypothetical protein